MLDFSDAMRLSKKVKNDKAHYREIIEDTDLCVCVTNSRGNFVACNKHYANMLGYRKDELIGRNFLMVVPEKRQKELAQLHDDFIDIQVEILRNWTIVGKDGHQIDISVDAGYLTLDGEGHKFTFIQPVRHYHPDGHDTRQDHNELDASLRKRSGEQETF